MICQANYAKTLFSKQNKTKTETEGNGVITIKKVNL